LGTADKEGMMKLDRWEGSATGGLSFAMKHHSCTLIGATVVVLLVVVAILGSSCQRPPADQPSMVQGPLIVFNAGALTAPLADLLREFVRCHPRVVPQQESSGSLDAVRKIAELGKPCDILAVADYELLPSLILPEHADWYFLFARNQMVLMYTPRSKFASEINSANWFEILMRPEVQCGYSDPDADPAGYRTLLHWQLAENYYHRPGLYEQLKSTVPAKNIRPKSVELVALLESGELDYIYGYRSIAEQNNLLFITFPPEIDLSDIKKANLYATATVEVAGKRPGERLKIKGTPILFGLTILKSAPHKYSAEVFVELMLSPEGQAIMKRNYLTVLSPPLANDVTKLTARLRDKFAPIDGAIEEAPKKR